MKMFDGAQLESLAAARNSLIQELLQVPAGMSWCRRHTQIVDDMIRAIATSFDPDHFAVVACGGYGRKELAPGSDVDLAVIPADETDVHVQTSVREFFERLDSYLGSVAKIPYGYSYRVAGDAAGLDAVSRTSLLDGRLVFGNSRLHRAFETEMTDTLEVGDFLISKLRERREWFRKSHDTPLVVEPNLKEGAGGVRSLHAANWIRYAMNEQPVRAGEAFDVVVRNRNLLHAISGKKVDQLSRSKQGEIADVIGKDPSTFMQEHAAAASSLHQEFERACERIHHARFELVPGIYADRGEVRFDGNADAGDAAVAISFATQLGIRVSEYRLSPVSFEKGASALFAIRSGLETVRNLDRCGLLERLLPELTACRTFMPNDTVHRYTVFEHTLRMVGVLDDLKSDRFYGELFDSLASADALYLAVLLHDVGKALPGRPHSEVGAEIAAEVCQRWHLESNLSQQVVWLVREHLTMDRFMRMRDLMHPDTVTEFAGVVHDPAQLARLTLLTAADISSVSETTYTPAIAHFLRQLYESTAAQLHGEAPEVEDPSLTRRRLLRSLAKEDRDPLAVQAFLLEMPTYYLASTPTEIARLHLHYVTEARAGKSTIDFTPNSSLSATEVTICVTDRPGLLHEILGALYAYDLSLLSVRATTTAGELPIALDTFVAAYAGKPIPSGILRELRSDIGQVIAGDLSVDELIQRKGKNPDHLQRLFTYSFTPGVPGILEIRSPRGRGMPYRFARLFSSKGWNIVSARVGQWAGNGAAAFYLTGPELSPLSPEEVDQLLQPLR